MERCESETGYGARIGLKAVKVGRSDGMLVGLAYSGGWKS
jgi:hypothetical protein